MQNDKKTLVGTMTENLGSAPFGSVGDFSSSLPLAVAAHAFDSEGEDALTLRYGRAKRNAENLVFEFTRDPALLHQYYKMYQHECRVIDNDTAFRDAEEEYNRRGHIIIVRLGNLCIGGARISVRTPRQTKPLPMEIGDFRLENYFPELKLKQMRYAELSRFVLLPEFRDGNIAQEMFNHFYRKSVALNIDMMFAAAPIANSRAYRKNCMAIGLKETKIHLDIEVPPYPGFEEIKDYVVSSVIDKALVKDQDLSSYKDLSVYQGEEA